MNHGRKVVCIGAAMQDVFLRGDIFRPHRDGGQLYEEFKLGSKQDVEEVVYSTGGGASNAAVTFARAGFFSCFMGRIGHDSAGSAVMDELHRDLVDTSLVKFTHEGTGYSVILLAPNGERTILSYRGASQAPEIHAGNFHHMSADWFYISTLGGDFKTLETVLDYAQEYNVKVALNPGRAELQHPEHLKSLLTKVEVLCLNKDEVQLLFRAEHIEHLAQAAAILVPIVAVTNGDKGVVACDGRQLIIGGIYEDVPAVDRTGAGDAFASGFTAMLAAGEPLSKAVIYGSANSTGVVKRIGAKPGIIHEHTKLHTMPLEIRERV